MLNHYYDNMGKKSKFTGDTITPKMISRVTERYLELGGKLTREPCGADSERYEEV